MNFGEISEGISIFIDLLNSDNEDVKIEFATWKTYCTDLNQPITDCLKALDFCDKRFYPNIHDLLKIFATLPVSSATAERSFSALKYLKSYLRSTMSEDRST